MESSDISASLVPPSLRTLLHGIIDYAGLFPPADLSLRRAIHNYAEYREDEEAWMLARFVLPVRRLPDLLPFQGRFGDGPPYPLSVLGTGGDDRDTFLDAFVRDLDVIETFDEQFGGRAQVDIMEVPLPPALVGSPQADLQAFFDAVHQRLVETGTAKLDLFFEVPLDDPAVKNLPAICAAAAEHNAKQALPERSEIGLKMRCGGAEAGDIPAVEHVASLLLACRDAGIALKATAGLHHPLRHYDDGLDTEAHGFLNVFGAAVLAAENHLDKDTIETILLEEHVDNFRFEKEAFHWRNLSVPLDGIRHARESLASSFGSCSFEEPIDHLRDLELL